MQQQATSESRLDELIDNIETGKKRMSRADAMRVAGQLYSKGRYKEAELVCRQLLENKSNSPDTLSILGVVLHALGGTKEGIASLKKAIKLAPKVASYRSNLGEVYRQQGNLADATVNLQKAIELDPKNAQAYNNLGIVRFESRAYEQAVQSYKRALELNPKFPEASNNLGNALRKLDDTEGALEAYQNALALREVYPEAYNNLGSLLRDQGKIDQAEQALLNAIKQSPKYLDAHVNLAGLYFSVQRDADALRRLSEAFKIAPNDIRALLLTARCQQRRGNPVAAEKACAMVLKQQPKHAEALTILAQLMHEADRYEDALKLINVAYEAEPENPEVLNFYGVVLKGLGRLDEAREKLFKALEIFPKTYAAYSNLNDLIDYKKEEALFAQLQSLVEGAENPDAPEVLPLHFAYAKALDDAGQHEKALEHFIKAGKIKRGLVPYNEEDTVKFFEDIRKTYPAKVFKDRPFAGDPTDKLVFIVGMPRSGSTLVEQILSSHEAVYGAGEVKHWSASLKQLRGRFPALSLYPAMGSELTEAQYQLLADTYRGLMLKNAGDAQRVTDKMLSNHFFIGLIHLCFPNAKIINTRRDPIDTCLSTFTKLFKDETPHSYDLAELGRYYRQYDALMKHWEKVLPKGVMKVVEYEKMVDDTEAEARALIEFLGLEWDDKLLDFHTSSRPIRTASVTQVRQPIYKSSVARWKKYGDGLQPLIDAIGKA